MIVRKVCVSGFAVFIAFLFVFGILLSRPMISQAQQAPNGQEVLLLDTNLSASLQKELASVEAAKLRFSGDGPKILIYHTHTTEAYSSEPGDTYLDWRTDDAQKNIIAVGEALAGYLEEYGIEVLHDQTNHENPKLSTAYTRSLITMQSYQERYPSIELYLDIHRDAGDTASVAVVDGKKAAPILFVVGTGARADDGVRPNYRENFAIAKQLFVQLNAMDTQLIQPIEVKTGRYNQHVGRSLLVNIGNNRNTLTEARNATQCLAKAISESIQAD